MGLEFKIAKTKKELRKAFRLRYDVFGKDCGYLKEKDYRYWIEYDDFDLFETTTNLIALDNGKAVGTARLSEEDSFIAERDNSYFGLPIEHVFDLSCFLDKDMKIGEISRSVIDKNYRCSRIIMTLWGCIIGFAKEKGLTHILTNANMETDCLEDANRIYDIVKKQNLVHQTIYTPPKKEFAEKKKNKNFKFRLFNEGQKRIPKTLKMYNKIGTKITSPPIYYEEFDMCSILNVLEFNNIKRKSKKYFDKVWDKFNRKLN